MPHYLRQEIEDILAEPFQFCKDQLKEIISQLLEENLILREGHKKIENNILMPRAPKTEESYLKEVARETLTKVNEVGKEKE